MLPTTLSFVDVETTGTNATYNRIIEIGIVRVEHNKIVAKYNSLVNPETHLDPFIANMTGIRPEDLNNAPTFFDIKEDILTLLTDSLFVAHSARFDYGFLKNEFKRFEISFTQKQLCTVKLARNLFPQLGRYNLDIIANAFHIAIKNRHRAFDDAYALFDFYKKAQKKVDKPAFQKAIDIVLRRPTTPIHLSADFLETLTESPGVYIFYGDKGSPLYIGKSINIKDRVLSHFSSDHAHAKEMKLSQQVKSIETIATAGELGALLLESTLIKKHKPLYNRMLRDTHALITLQKIKTLDGYYSVQVTNELQKAIGVFRSHRQANEALLELAKEHLLCQKLLGLEKTKRACFGYQLNTCHGACIGKESVLKYNLRFDEAFYKLKIRRWPFTGPIIITEKGEKDEYYTFNNWCLMESNNPLPFDYDTYKILVRFILNKNNQKKIKVLKPSDLSLRGTRRIGGDEANSEDNLMS